MVIKEKYIFWDWNGTLLNDTNICVSVMNDMLDKRRMNNLDVDYYKEVFGFPVINYYKKLGFDFEKESFEALSAEFIKNYSLQALSVPLAKNSELVLKYFREQGKKNIILSVMQQDMLVSLVKHTGINSYFSDILGIDNIYAHSKSLVAVDYLKNKKINSDQIIMIGDTLHDYEVASEIGCKCILISHGHQSELRLMKSGAMVLNSLIELIQD
jgi:phosphoglycolate phosphatase